MCHELVTNQPCQGSNGSIGYCHRIMVNRLLVVNDNRVRIRDQWRFQYRRFLMKPGMNWCGLMFIIFVGYIRIRDLHIWRKFPAESMSVCPRSFRQRGRKPVYLTESNRCFLWVFHKLFQIVQLLLHFLVRVLK